MKPPVTDALKPTQADRHVPGLYHCAVCGFQLVQSTIRAADGAIFDRDNPGERCPNDGHLLGRVTWKAHAEDMAERATEYLQRAVDAEERIASLAASEAERGGEREACAIIRDILAAIPIATRTGRLADACARAGGFLVEAFDTPSTDTPAQGGDIKARARELLAIEQEKDGNFVGAQMTRNYRPSFGGAAERAIEAALSHPLLSEVEEVLEPFAKASEIRLCGEWADGERIQGTDIAFYITFGHLRAASALLAKLTGAE